MPCGQIPAQSNDKDPRATSTDLVLVSLLSISERYFFVGYILPNITLCFFVCLKLALSIFDQCSIYGQTRYLVFTGKMFENHQWKSDSLSSVTLPQVILKHFASKNQLLGFYRSGTLAENGLRSLLELKIQEQPS